jgi:hypothetical protein
MQIPKIKLIPQPENKEAAEAMGYEWNDAAETRHFLGGHPEGLLKDTIQSAINA